MRLDLAVYDTQGRTRGYARLRLDFGQGAWTVEEDAQRAWRNAGFSASGPFETMDDDVIWVWDQEIGNPKCNTVVLDGVPLDDSAEPASGRGRIVTGQIGKFLGGTVYWSVVESLPSAMQPASLELVASRDSAIRLPSELAA